MTAILRPLQVVFIGAGAMGREHAKAFADIPGVKLAGVWNRSRGNAELFAAEMGVAKVFDDIDAMHAETDADLAVMAVYETAISAVAARVLARPWAVLMEKPVGLDFADAEKVERLAAGRTVFVGLNRRAMSSTVAALDDLARRSGPRYIHVCDQQSQETARTLGHDFAVIRSWMYANSIHLVDYLTAFGRGEVTGVERLTPWTPDAPGVVLAKVSFSSGDIGLYEGIWNGPGPWACTVSTPERRWEMRPLEKAVFQNAGERALNPVEPHPWDQAFKPGFRLQAERVAAALRGEPSLAPTLAEAMRTTRLVRAIYGA